VSYFKISTRRTDYEYQHEDETHIIGMEICLQSFIFINNLNWLLLSSTEARKGHITPWDLERMANVNEFIWTDSEISKMICCFDRDGDGKVCPFS
jgi:hypothetical protein